jgi:tRNA A-37 threonylcarbamoyl transferase component Bud32
MERSQMGGTADIGDHIGGYVLESVLGEGGMGAVFLGTHALLGRRAAVKVLYDRLAGDAELVSRFFNEARIVNDVRHPNIVDIVDFVETEAPRRVAYVIELVAGPPLNQALREHRFTPLQAINICGQIVSALAAVHAIGVVHRDLKPGNVLLMRPPTETDFSEVHSVKVVDFGIAKVAHGDTQHRTRTGALMGTPAYMSPEQVAGDPTDTPADVYAIGELLYELVAGAPVYRGENREVLRAKLSGAVPAVPIPAEIPEARAFADLVAACLRADPAERPGLDEVHDRLEILRRSLEHRATARIALPTLDEAEELVLPGGPDPAARRRLALAAALTVLLGAGAGVGWWWWSARPDATPLTPEIVSIAGPEPGRPEVAHAATSSSATERVRIESLPPGAAVFDAEGRSLGVTPLQLDLATGSSRSLSLRLDGHVEETLTVDGSTPRIEVGLVAEVAETPEVTRPRGHRGPRRPPREERPRPPEPKLVEPKPTTGRVRIEAWTTAGRALEASVEIDGRAVPGKTPLDFRARPGTRVVRVTAAGFPTRTRRIEVTAGGESTVPFVVDLE